jgi:hypothetical protein
MKLIVKFALNIPEVFFPRLPESRSQVPHRWAIFTSCAVLLYGSCAQLTLVDSVLLGA